MPQCINHYLKSLMAVKVLEISPTWPACRVPYVLREA
jgi:hypothetical protein